LEIDGGGGALHPGRRRFLSAAAAAMALTGTVARGEAPAGAARGPRVWRDLDQAALDAAYDQSVWAANMAQVVARYASESDAVRARLGAPRRFAYGDVPIEALDVYAPERADAPVNVFIHGGAWRSSSAASFAFPAEMFLDAGACWVVPDFAWVQDAGGSLAPLAAQVQRALAWVHAHAREFGGDPDRVYVSGHSSGAHLAAVALTADWPREHGVRADFIRGALLVSGMFDLEPVRRSARSQYIAFTDEMVERLSPQRHLDRLIAPLIIACGTLESPEFQRQSREFAAAVETAGKPARLLFGEGYNHFDILETLANPFGLLGRAVLEQMELTA
jgi:arylformamidase